MTGMSEKTYNKIRELLETCEVNIDLKTGIYTGAKGKHAIYTEGASPGKDPIKVKAVHKHRNDEREYLSISEATRDLGLDFSNVAKSVKKIYKSAGGWEFYPIE